MKASTKIGIGLSIAAVASVSVAVDDLSDDELDSVLNVVDRVKDGGSKLAEYGEKVKDNTDSLKERFFTFIEDAMK